MSRADGSGTRGGRVTIRELREGTDPALGRAYSLLRRTFPPHELVPKRELVATLHERAAGVLTDLNWHMFVAEHRGRVVGAASGWYVGSLNIGVIGYVLVARGQRSGGLGPRIRRRLRQAFERDATRIRGIPLRALVGEVEERNPWLRHLVNRRDALALDITYLQPAIGDARPVPLVLYWESLGAPRRSISVATARKLLYALWRRLYRVQRPLEDRSFRKMLQQLQGRRRIAARRLPQLPRRVPRGLGHE